MFKKRAPPSNLRRREEKEDEEDGDGAPLPEPQTKQMRKGIDANEVLNLTKEAKKQAAEEVKEVFTHDADGRLISEDSQRVFTQLDVDTEKSHDHRAVLERNYEISEKIRAGELESGVYRGQGAYLSHLKQREDAIRSNKYTGLHGPLRANQFARTTLRIDYNPEICKDYKETGYCGFGDTCKFLHDRSDYKSGWQIDKEWEEEQRRKQQELAKKKAQRDKMVAAEHAKQGGV